MRNNNKNLTILHLVILDYAGEIKEGWKRVKGADIVLWFWDFLFIFRQIFTKNKFILILKFL